MRRVMGLALMLAACSGRKPPEAAADAATTESQPDSSRPLLDRVNEAADFIASGGPADLARAVALLEPLVDEDPTGTARFDLGLAYEGLGRLDQAAQTFERVVSDAPEFGDAWLYLGQAREGQARWADAEDAYRSGIGQDPEHMGLRVALIAVLRRQDRPDEAIDAAKAALKVNAKALAVYNNFALAYLDKGDTTLARFILQKALQGVEGAANNAYVHTNLGWSYYLDGNKAAAKESLTRAVELQPDLVPALVQLSRVYLEDRNHGDMIPLLETAKAVDPTSADVQINLGIAYRGVGRLDDARKAYEQALVLDPKAADPHFNLGILLGDYNKDYDGAIAEFERYVAAAGPLADRARQYIDDVSKEKERAERREKADAARQAREAERERQQQLLEQAPGAEGADAPTDAAPIQPSDSDPDPAPDEGAASPDDTDDTSVVDGDEAPPEDP